MKKHTGKTSHGNAHMGTHGGKKDKMVHPSHHAANAQYGTPGGIHAPPEMQEEGEDEGGGGMHENEAACD